MYNDLEKVFTKEDIDSLPNERSDKVEQLYSLFSNIIDIVDSE